MTLQVALENAGQTPLQLHKTIAALDINQLDAMELTKSSLSKDLAAFKRNLHYLQEKMPNQTHLETALERSIAEVQPLHDAIPVIHRIASLRKADTLKVTDEVILLVCWVQEQLNVSHNMSDVQIEMLAIDIVQNYSTFRLEDVAACFKNGLKGLYGKIFERLDASVLHGWLMEYGIQRRQKWEQYSLSAHQSQKESRHYNAETKPRQATAAADAVKATVEIMQREPLNKGTYR